MAFKSDQPQLNNNQKEVSMEDEALTAEQTSGEEVVVKKDGVPIHPDQLELPLNMDGQTAQTPAESEETIPDLTPKEYAKQEIDEYAKQGFAGMVYSCFDALMESQYQWNVSHSQIDEALTKIRANYPGTCAALASYKERGEY